MLQCVLGDLGPGIDRRDRCHGWEDVQARRRLGERLDDHEAPFVLLGAAELRLVGLRDDDVEGARAHEHLERSREDDLGLVDRPGVERVAGREVVREAPDQLGGHCFGERLERHPGRLGLVGEKRALAARLRDGGDARPTGSARAAEHLEGLDERREVVHLDRSVSAQQRGERALRPDDRARVGEGRTRASLGAADLEADDRLSTLGAAGERGGEGSGPANGLEEEADRRGVLVLREEVEKVGGVADRLPTRRDDAPKADARADAEEGLGDRARLRDDRDKARPEGVGHRPDPERQLAGGSDAHAVRADERRALGRRALGDAPCDLGARGARLVPEPRQEERANARGERVLEGLPRRARARRAGRRAQASPAEHRRSESTRARALRPARDARPTPAARSGRLRPRSARGAAKRRRRRPTWGRGEGVPGCDGPSSAHTILSNPKATVHEKQIEIRWRDQDAYGHVNNAVYLTYLEEVRDEWLERALGEAGDAWGYVTARVRSTSAASSGRTTTQ